MAEGLAHARWPGARFIQSAGAAPSFVHPDAIEVMKEKGIDITAQSSKSVETIDPETVRTVITLCADAVCPTFLGNARQIHWPLSDPADPTLSEVARLGKFRKIRDVIDERLESLT
jgi:arsenate reductase